MKLMVCRDCLDTVALGREIRRCRCGKSGGVYLEDGLKAEVVGPCSLFGINSSEMARWVERNKRGVYPEPYTGTITAWAMPKNPANIRRVRSL